MAITVDWPNKFITVPKSELTLITGTRYKITVSYWWQLLREMNATEEGIVFDTMYNSTAATSSTPQIVDLINGYTAEFEDGLYSVELIDGNSNWREIEVKNLVSVGTNNTTGFIDPTFLEAGLFPDGVILDVVNGVAGIGKTPSGGIIGTRQTPSSNAFDSHDIGEIRGTRRFTITNDITLSGVDLSDGHFLVCDSPYTQVTIDPSADVTNCSMTNMSIPVGALDGLNLVERCFLGIISDVSGIFHHNAFSESVALNGDTNIFNCYSSVTGSGYPVFNVGSHAVTIRDYRGSLGIQGATAGHLSSIGVKGGRIVIESSCTGGEIHVRGEPFEIVDNSGAGCTVIDETEGAKINDMWQFQGLDPENPANVTDTGSGHIVDVDGKILTITATGMTRT